MLNEAPAAFRRCLALSHAYTIVRYLQPISGYAKVCDERSMLQLTLTKSFGVTKKAERVPITGGESGEFAVQSL